MSWRTVIISKKCKLSYKNNYLIVRNDEIQMIHLSEINIIIVDTIQASITSYLLSEIAQRKIKIIFCDEQRNPISELVPYYGSHNTSKRILNQVKWKKTIKDKVWCEIVKCKIEKQAMILKYFEKENSDKLLEYIKEVQPGDITNREGHAAKVYFNSLFGNEFNRDKECIENSALNYGYSIILSTFNKEIVSKGYITQLGLNHKNEYNFFNFSCDLMEPFRPLIDAIVFKSKNKIFDKDYRYDLINLLNMKIKIDDKEQYVSNAIKLYVQSVVDAIEKEDSKLVLKYEL
ncbi:MAG: type II CRISPR-associated endonuclease Cas1 [Clostridia bacterium]